MRVFGRFGRAIDSSFDRGSLGWALG